MESTVTKVGTLLIEYAAEDCQRFNDSRRGFHNPVPEEAGKILFGASGTVEHPSRLSAAGWIFADWLRDEVLSGSQQTPRRVAAS